MKGTTAQPMWQYANPAQQMWKMVVCGSWNLLWNNYCRMSVCVQEVETEQFYSFFLPELQADGYDGIFAPKSRARTMTDADKKHVDGCAIFYKHSK